MAAIRTKQCIYNKKGIIVFAELQWRLKKLKRDTK